MTKREKRGLPGRRGLPGTKGRRGLRGTKGPTGKRGARGPQVTRTDILSAVGKQFDTTRKEVGGMSEEVKAMSKSLDTQLVRMAQIQVQLDHIQKLVQAVLDGAITD